MNYYKSKLNLIRVALGMDVKMADAVLEDGVTRVEAESFEPGMKIFVVSEDGERAPAPEGVHTAQDGTKITVDSEGTITLVESPEPVEAEEVKEEVEVKAAEEEVKEEVKVEGEEHEPKPEKEMLEEIVDKKIEEAMEKVYMALEEVVKEVSEVKEEMASYKEKMSKTPASKKVSTFNSESSNDNNVLESRLDHLKELKASLGKRKNF
jgi:hypothetical protein